MEPQILKENPKWVVINKPSGLHSTHSKKCSGCVEEWIKKRWPETKTLPEHGLTHRLDEKTSGCLLIARSSQAYTHFRKAFQNKEGLEKTYHALVEGHPKVGRFQFYFRGRYKGSKKVSVFKTGKPQEQGECEIRVLQRLGSQSLLEVRLLGPGRRHQIRAGLSYLGHPIRGDSLYGGKPWADYFGLHAYSLKSRNANENPGNLEYGLDISVEAPFLKSLKSA